MGMFAKGQYAIQHQPFKVAVSTATDHGDLSVLKSRQSRRVVRRKNLSLSQITIRPMRKSDVEAAARCWASTYPEQGGVDKLPHAFLCERTLTQFRPRIAERVECTFVATDQDRVLVGFVTARDSEIEQLFLLPCARGAGVAEKLLEAGENLLESQGTQMFFLYVFGENRRARLFYERCGYLNMGAEQHEVEVSGGKRYNLDLLRYRKGGGFSADEMYGASADRKECRYPAPLHTIVLPQAGVKSNHDVVMKVLHVDGAGFQKKRYQEGNCNLCDKEGSQDWVY